MADAPRNEQNYFVPNTIGSTVPFNDIGTVPRRILEADPNRGNFVVFNPGGVDVLLYQGAQRDGDPFSATFADPGGGIILSPGSDSRINGEASQSPWYAIARSGSSNSLTIILKSDVRLNSASGSGGTGGGYMTKPVYDPENIGADVFDLSNAHDGTLTDAKVAQPSALYNRIHDLPSVKDPEFAGGAKGDGVTDDTAALQAALDSNGVVSMPPGRYRITSPLVIDPRRNRGNGFKGLSVISLYPDTTQPDGPVWDGTEEAVIWYDGPADADLTSTSATNVGLVSGTRGLTVEAGKAYAPGMTVVVRRTADPNNFYMSGTITTYDTGTGAMTVDVTLVKGAGTFSGWDVKVPTAVITASSAPITIEPNNSFSDTIYGFILHDIICHGNEKAQFGFYSARIQDGNMANVIGYRCRMDGIYMNGAYSGNYSSLLGYRNWGRGVSLGSADFDYGWVAQGALNRITFIDTWGYANGRAGEYNEADPIARLKGCGIFFGPHRGCSLVGWTGEVNDGVGLIYAPTSNANHIYNGYTELNSSIDVTGNGSAISTGRATEQRGLMFYGAPGGVSWGNKIEYALMAAEKLWLAGSTPSANRTGLIAEGVFGNGTVSSFPNYLMVDCSVEMLDNINGQRPLSHGAWTPVLQGSTTAGSNAYSVNVGGMNVENDWVILHWSLVLSAKDAAMAGGIQIPVPLAAKALPSNIIYSGTISEFDLATAARPVAFIRGGDQFITLKKDTGTGNTTPALAPTDLSATSRISGMIQYRFR